MARRTGKDARGGEQPVEHYAHGSETRPNLPTAQTSQFMDAKDRRPVPYGPPVPARSHPWLEWDRGESLETVETPATPLYIHEKIHPASFVESLSTSSPQSALFADFNNLPEEADYDWYQHRGNWQNRIVRGEACHVMASLLEKEGMAGQVQAIYFDPPYGIGFKSNMQGDVRRRDVGSGKKDIPNDPGVVKAFRDTYRNGVHSYLDNVYRIALHAHALLHASGSLFLQIGSANVHRVAVLLDEIFGAQNRVATIPFAKSGGTSSQTLPEVADYLLWYARERPTLKYRQLYEPLTRVEKLQHMNWDAMVELGDGTARPLTADERTDPERFLPDDARLFRRMPLTSRGASTTGRSDPYEWAGRRYQCPPGEQWRVSKQGLDRLSELGRLIAASDDSSRLGWKRYEDEIPGRRIHNLWSAQMSPSDMHYVVETAESVVERCLLMSTDPGDLVLDPTCGSGTTAYVAEKWGRRWITTDCAAVAVSLARQRLATAVFDYHLLQDSRAGGEKEAELTGGAPVEERSYERDPARGFVYERAPSVSAASLAYDRHDPPVLLVNRPYRSPGILRVSSPFTVESHSPYRVLDPEAALEIVAAPDRGTAPVRGMGARAIVEALGTSGIKDGEGRVAVEDIEEHVGADGSWITHYARTAEGRAALLVAPDDLTVSSHLVNLAAEEAAGIPTVRVLIVVAFAFEPEVRNEARGRLTIHKAQANRDLLIGNLVNEQDDVAFVRIGEPDVRIEAVGDGQLVVEVLGFDTFDPNSGQLRPGQPNDIHCWMIDTEYDGLSFFARRIHFPGADRDRQVARLGRRLGRRVDPALWASMLGHRSAPFDRPATGRIAVRIVTNTHTEMTAVREVPTEEGLGGGRSAA